MKLSTGFLFALASVSDAKKGGKKKKENNKKPRISGEYFGEHCLAEKNGGVPFSLSIFDSEKCSHVTIFTVN